MIHPAHQENNQIDHVHITALCREISERLIVGLGNKPIAMPPHLMALMSRLRDEPSKSVNPNPLKSFLAHQRWSGAN